MVYAWLNSLTLRTCARPSTSSIILDVRSPKKKLFYYFFLLNKSLVIGYFQVFYSKSRKEVNAQDNTNVNFKVNILGDPEVTAILHCNWSMFIGKVA